MAVGDEDGVRLKLDGRCDDFVGGTGGDQKPGDAGGGGRSGGGPFDAREEVRGLDAVGQGDGGGGKNFELGGFAGDGGSGVGGKFGGLGAVEVEGELGGLGQFDVIEDDEEFFVDEVGVAVEAFEGRAVALFEAGDYIVDLGAGREVGKPGEWGVLVFLAAVVDEECIVRRGGVCGVVEIVGGHGASPVVTISGVGEEGLSESFEDDGVEVELAVWVVVDFAAGASGFDGEQTRVGVGEVFAHDADAGALEDHAGWQMSRRCGGEVGVGGDEAEDGGGVLMVGPPLEDGVFEFSGEEKCLAACADVAMEVVAEVGDVFAEDAGVDDGVRGPLQLLAGLMEDVGPAVVFQGVEQIERVAHSVGPVASVLKRGTVVVSPFDESHGVRFGDFDFA